VSSVRAVDVGYGNTKYVLAHPTSGDVQCALFPSVAVQANSSADLTAGALQRLNTVVVEVNGVQFEVGKDADLAQDLTHARVLDRDFCKTDIYLALLRGALHYMGCPSLDLLVLGLPLNTFGTLQHTLAKRVKGCHPVPAFAIGAPGRAVGLPTHAEVLVREVYLLPQPLGALFDHAIQQGQFAKLQSHTSLIVDVGFFTFDWLFSHGVKPIASRSGAVNGGLSAILSVIAAGVGKQFDAQITNVKRLDQALRTGTSLRLFGQEHDITHHISAGEAKAREFVAAMASRVGDGADVDNIILCGGGAHFFHALVREKYPRHNVVIARDPVFANLRGFQLAGEQRVRLHDAQLRPSATA